MSKIVQVINKMISNHKSITNVIKTEDEYFFLYNNKYKWSIAKGTGSNKGEYYLHVYPEDFNSLEDLSRVVEWDENSPSFTTYKTSDFKTIEAYESFGELYQVVQDKLYGINDILDDILSD